MSHPTATRAHRVNVPRAPHALTFLEAVEALANLSAPPPWCASPCACPMPAACRSVWRLIRSDETDRRDFLRSVRRGYWMVAE